MNNHIAEHDELILEVKNLKKFYKAKTNSHFFGKKENLEAVGGIDLSVYKGEIIGIIGESGCGKSTLGKLFVNLEPPTDGEILFRGTPVQAMLQKHPAEFRKTVQMVFQNPFDTFLQTETIEKIMIRPLQLYASDLSHDEQLQKVIAILEEGGLRPAQDFLPRYTHELSGGQLQRISILRSMLLNPAFLVVDEPVSMLDVSVRADVINMILDLKEKYQTSIIFISHDISVVRYVADRIAVMYLGRIVEEGSTEELLSNPKHPYTKALISNCMTIDLDPPVKRIKIKGEIPSPINPGPGCYFCKRCYAAKCICQETYPDKTQITDNHFAYCHLLCQKGEKSIES